MLFAFSFASDCSGVDFFSRYLTDFSQKCLLYPSVDGLDIDEVVIWEKLLKKEKRFVEREKVPVF